MRPARISNPVLVFAVALMMITSAALVGAFAATYPPLLLLSLFALAFGCGLILLLNYLTPAAPLWVRCALVVVFFLLLLDRGFSGISIGTGTTRVTLAETVILIAFIANLNRNSRVLTASPLGLLLLVAAVAPIAVHLLPGIEKYGVVAARDALHQVDMLAFFVGAGVCLTGYRLASWRIWRDRFWRCALLLGGAYLVTFPMASEVLRYSPTVFAYQQSIPIFGYYPVGMVWWGMLALFMMPGLIGHGLKSAFVRLMLTVVFVVDFVLVQSRAMYVIAPFSSLLLLWWGYGRQALKLGLIAAAGLAAMVALDFGDVQLEGRVGNLGLNTVVDQLLSISGGEHGLQSGAFGVRQRAEWREKCLGLWSSDLETMVFGVGYGMALTDFTTIGTEGNTVVVREPHNSFLSVLVRTGLVGFVPWVIFLGGMLWQTLRLAARQRNIDPGEAAYHHWLFLLIISYLITALVEPIFEMPNLAVFLYFLLGTILGEIMQAGTVPRATDTSKAQTSRIYGPAR